MEFVPVIMYIIHFHAFQVYKAYQIRILYLNVCILLQNRKLSFFAESLSPKITFCFLLSKIQVLPAALCKILLSCCFHRTVVEVLQYKIHFYQPQAPFDAAK